MREKSLFNSILFQIAFSLSIIASVIFDFYNKMGLPSRTSLSGFIKNLDVNPLVNMVLNTAIFIITGLVTIYFGRKFKLIERNKDYALVFFLFSFLYHNVLLSSITILIPCLLMVLVFGLFLQIYNQSSVQKILFYASVLIAISTFFDIILSLSMPLLLVGNFIIRPFSIKDFLICLLAFVLPFLYYSAWLFVTDQPQFVLDSIEFNFQELSIGNWVFVAVLGFIILQSFVARSKMIAQQRNQMSFMVLIALVSLALGLFYNQDFLFLAVVPSACFASNFYNALGKKWIVDSIVLLLFVLYPLLKFI